MSIIALNAIFFQTNKLFNNERKNSKTLENYKKSCWFEKNKDQIVAVKVFFLRDQDKTIK